jgi:hypothetical protein
MPVAYRCGAVYDTVCLHDTVIRCSHHTGTWY